MKKIAILCASILVISGCSYLAPQPIQTDPTENVGDNTSTKEASVDTPAEKDVEDAEIIISTVAPGDTVTSPVAVKGKALGTWFFEGTLPVQMEDSKGDLIGMAPAHALDDWMTEDYVRFEADLTFKPAGDTSGTIIIKNDNPSGMKEHEKVHKIKVKFADTEESSDKTKEPSKDDLELIGGDTDEHGCIGPAGYIWCESKQKCLRVWEEPCEEETATVTEEDIKSAFSKKYPDWNMDEMEIEIVDDMGKHASGGIREKGSEIGGGYWFAAKTTDGWIIAADGNGSIFCEDINLYNFPADMIAECIDGNGQIVERTESF